MLTFKYITIHFIKYFLIILLALTLFAVGLEYSATVSEYSLPANLQLIFLVYKAFFSIDMLLPISLVFAMISTKVFLIRSNALVSFYSLGYSKVDILRPFVYVSTFIILLFIAIHANPTFARANEFANNIKKNAEYLSPTTDLFFSYKDKFIYFSKMIPLRQRAEGIRVFKAYNGSLKEVVVAKVANYEDGYWHIKNADIIIKPDNISYNSMGIKVKSNQDLKLLYGFRPKMLDRVYEGKVNFTIQDAFEALFVLKDENVNIDSIKGAIYKIFAYPLFAPLLVVIIFFFVPISSRNINISLFTFGAILSTLLIWGIMFMFSELAKNRTISSEVGMLLPVFILFVVAIRQWRKYRLST